jgi:hypothetical protein
MQGICMDTNLYQRPSPHLLTRYSEAPMFWGPVSGCLLILSLTTVGLALVPVSDFWLLMLFRCIQAAGSASTIAIGSYTFLQRNRFVDLMARY